MAIQLAGQLPVEALQLSPIWRCNILQKYFATFAKKCLQKTVYGEKVSPKAETMHEKIKRYQEKADRHNASQPYRDKDKGAIIDMPLFDVFYMLSVCAFFSRKDFATKCCIFIIRNFFPIQ